MNDATNPGPDVGKKRERAADKTPELTLRRNAEGQPK